MEKQRKKLIFIHKSQVQSFTFRFSIIILKLEKTITFVLTKGILNNIIRKIYQKDFPKGNMKN